MLFFPAQPQCVSSLPSPDLVKTHLCMALCFSLYPRLIEHLRCCNRACSICPACVHATKWWSTANCCDLCTSGERYFACALCPMASAPHALSRPSTAPGVLLSHRPTRRAYLCCPPRRCGGRFPPLALHMHVPGMRRASLHRPPCCVWRLPQVLCSACGGRDQRPPRLPGPGL